MAAKRSVERAQKAIDRWNREREQIEKLRERLYRLEQKNRESYGAMFDALPEGFGVILPDSYSDEPARLGYPSRKDEQ